MDIEAKGEVPLTYFPMVRCFAAACRVSNGHLQACIPPLHCLPTALACMLSHQGAHHHTTPRWSAPPSFATRSTQPLSLSWSSWDEN